MIYRIPDSLSRKLDSEDKEGLAFGDDQSKYHLKESVWAHQGNGFFVGDDELESMMNRLPLGVDPDDACEEIRGGGPPRSSRSRRSPRRAPDRGAYNRCRVTHHARERYAERVLHVPLLDVHEYVRVYPLDIDRDVLRDIARSEPGVVPMIDGRVNVTYRERVFVLKERGDSYLVVTVLLKWGSAR